MEDNKNFNENAIVSCFHGNPTRGAYEYSQVHKRVIRELSSWNVDKVVLEDFSIVHLETISGSLKMKGGID